MINSPKAHKVRKKIVALDEKMNRKTDLENIFVSSE